MRAHTHTHTHTRVRTLGATCDVCMQGTYETLPTSITYCSYWCTVIFDILLSIETVELPVRPGLAVPWLRSLVTGLSPRRLRVRVRVNPCGILDKVALGQVFLRVFRFSPVSIIPPSRNMLT
jgi:hypothetical protein